MNTQTNHSSPSQESKGIFIGLLAMALFSAVDGIFKFTFQSAGFAVVQALSYFTASVGLLLYAGANKLPLRLNNKLNGLIFALIFLFEQLCFIYALKYIPMAELFVVILATPVFVLFLARFFLHEKLSGLQTASILSGFAGALLVAATPLLNDGSTTVSSAHGAVDSRLHYLPWILAILNVVFNGSKIIYLRRYCQNENTISLSLYAGVLFAIFFGVQSFRDLPHLTTTATVLIVLSGIISAASQLTYLRAFQLARASLASATQYSQMIWATLIGLIVFNEVPSMIAVIGTVLIFLSGFLLMKKEI